MILNTIQNQKSQALGKLNASAHAFPDLDQIFPGDIFSANFLPSHGDGSDIEISESFNPGQKINSFVCQTDGVHMISYSLKSQLPFFAKAELRLDGRPISGEISKIFNIKNDWNS